MAAAGCLSDLPLSFGSAKHSGGKKRKRADDYTMSDDYHLNDTPAIKTHVKYDSDGEIQEKKTDIVEPVIADVNRSTEDDEDAFVVNNNDTPALDGDHTVTNEADCIDPNTTEQQTASSVVDDQAQSLVVADDPPDEAGESICHLHSLAKTV
ncbi:hypothetical protein PINS_up001265 [Pythium insidiosum]|nr:hypothetical protein PINS_up001265 [Pythium insidiosum]